MFKQPITDGGKTSKPGRLKLVLNERDHGTELVTVPVTDARPDQLNVVFRNGQLLIDQTFAQIRAANGGIATSFQSAYREDADPDHETR